MDQTTRSTNNTKHGDAIDARAVQLGIPLREVAERAGIKIQTLNSARKGRHQMRQETANKIASALGWAEGWEDRVDQGLPPIVVEGALNVRQVPGVAPFSSGEKGEWVVDRGESVDYGASEIIAGVPVFINFRGSPEEQDKLQRALRKTMRLLEIELEDDGT